MEFTIDELAQRVAMTVRNIREWQTLGLVPPPVRRGRVGIYSREHVAIIERVKHLRAQGLPLDLIRRFTEPGTDSEEAVRRLAAEALSPLAATEPVVLPRAELQRRLGDGADDVLIDAGLVQAVDASTVSAPDAGIITAIEQLVEAGLSLPRLADTIADLEVQQRAIAQRLIDRYVDDVWQPAADTGFADADWVKLADTATKAKSIAVALMGRVFAKAFDEVADGVLVQKATEADASLSQGRNASTA
ncbi:MerR family transcriptional regulator [Mycobacterium sp. 1274756.6]|uniref:MerR family transcriptional regulator n=1 Tax=Mycobacterium sp. 1274756.6 TaxID=1834076 RepID=UPI0007FBDFA7|nr:MerR family transcriptional regulator [Mycobacterium sp. 1274756.6]OBJ68003.1 MerR family transcriptional regulator [Mycobacterium sp. 1274756.6]